MRNEKVFFLVLLIFLVELSKGQNNNIRTQVNVGVVADVGATYSDVPMLCINMSLNDFYSSRPQFQTRLVLNVGDSRTDVVGAAAAALELIKNKQVKAILGPWTSMQAHFLIEIGQKSQVPVVSYSATSPFLTFLRSPYFLRATYEDSAQVHAIKAIIKLFGWREVVPVYIDNTFGEGIQRSRWRENFPGKELNVYGLWAYDAITALAIAIEKAGTNNLTFSAADPGRNVSELESLGLSRYGPMLLRTLSGVQFKGLAGDFRFVKGQLQPSVFEIVNLEGAKERSIGFWTEENGLVKKLDQQPRSMSALSTWKEHLEQILWPGKADFVPKGWEIPTNGKRLRIGVPKRTCYPDLVKVTRDPITNSQVVT
ncbi:hypothetical protein AALP_AAs56165U000200, partial [Arabis alpina]